MDERNDGEPRDSHIVTVAGLGVSPAPARVPRSRSAPRHRRVGEFGFRDILIFCGIPVAIVLLVRLFVFGVYSIPSGSMESTIMPGDRVMTIELASKLSHLSRGDVVVFKDPAHWLSEETKQTYGNSDYLIKRLVGLPGDSVACAGPGQPVTINGKAVDETSYIRPGVDPSGYAFSVKVTEGHVFVMGDNRSDSADSRAHQNDGSNGLVPESDVKGVGIAVYWPVSHWKRLDAHHAVFDGVPALESAS